MRVKIGPSNELTLKYKWLSLQLTIMNWKDSSKTHCIVIAIAISIYIMALISIDPVNFPFYLT